MLVATFASRHPISLCGILRGHQAGYEDIPDMYLKDITHWRIGKMGKKDKVDRGELFAIVNVTV